ncbi:hypothetical protein FGIG_02227 [Fasciola gigantica]|uniref:Uncharacterized protein n=1 Tax=Fasciola gigantica TaxID=46835 RepID=A0A504YAH6_FASGI|nr:hypothetical protein FGIG_02227 [Fasciola gigantica]
MFHSLFGLDHVSLVLPVMSSSHSNSITSQIVRDRIVHCSVQDCVLHPNHDMIKKDQDYRTYGRSHLTLKTLALSGLSCQRTTVWLTP